MVSARHSPAQEPRSIIGQDLLNNIIRQVREHTHHRCVRIEQRHVRAKNKPLAQPFLDENLQRIRPIDLTHIRIEIPDSENRILQSSKITGARASDQQPERWMAGSGIHNVCGNDIFDHRERMLATGVFHPRLHDDAHLGLRCHPEQIVRIRQSIRVIIG